MFAQLISVPYEVSNEIQWSPILHRVNEVIYDSCTEDIPILLLLNTNPDMETYATGFRPSDYDIIIVFLPMRGRRRG